MGIAQKHWYRFTFLKSDRWRDFRIEALVFHGQICVMCRSESKPLDIHHIWYPKREEEVWDVRPLCRECHDLAHEKTNPKAYKDYELAVAEFSKLVASLRKSPSSALKQYKEEIQRAENDTQEREALRMKEIKRYEKDAKRQVDWIRKYRDGLLGNSKRDQNMRFWVDAHIGDPDFIKVVKEVTGIELNGVDSLCGMVQSHSS